MLKMLLAVSVLLFPVFSFAQVTHSLPKPPGDNDATLQLTSRLGAPDYQADFPPAVANGLVTPRWDKQHLVSAGTGETGEPVSLYDKHGALLFDTRLVFQGAAKVYIEDVAVTASETVVVATVALQGDGKLADLIVEIDKAGIRRAIQTSPFYPLKICATAEGTVWAYGWERGANGGDRHGHHDMLREYSFERGQLRSALDRSTLQTPPGIPVNGQPAEVRIKCGSHKVALFSGPSGELIEYDLATGRLTRWPLPPFPQPMSNRNITGSAITDSGELYVSTELVGEPSKTGIFRLQISGPNTTAWETISFFPAGGKWFRLLGNDGERLVYSRGLRSPTVFWSTVKLPEVTK